MNAVLFRLMWKEYRVLRGFWLALAVFGLVCDGLILALVANPQDRLPGLFGFAGVLPACFALGAGATLFAAEREELTRDFLRYLPLRSSQVFVGKVLLAMCDTLLLTGVLLGAAMGGAALAFGNNHWPPLAEPSAAQTAAIYALVVLHALGWGVFFSLRSARPLLAAVLGATCALCCMTLMHVLTLVAPDNGLWPKSDWGIPAAHFLAAAAVWAIDVWLGSLWLHGRRKADRLPHRSAQTPSPRSRLIWQEWRRSRRMLAVLIALGLLLPWAGWGDPNFVGVGVIPYFGAILALLGACAFLGDQERSQFRFFAERGISPRTVWSSRQLFWAGAALGLAALVLAGHLYVILFAAPRFSDFHPRPWTRPQFVLSWFALDIGAPGTSPHGWKVQCLSGLAGYVVWISLAYGAGQLASMFQRSGLVAAVFGVILAELLLGWAALMQLLAIGWWWSVAPLAVALFAATWLRSTGWILERHGWRAWLRPAMVLVAPMIALPALVPVYRVWEVPVADVALPPVTVNPEADEAVQRLLRACRAIAWREAGVVSDVALVDPGHAAPSEGDRQWVAENAAALEKTIRELSKLPAESTLEIAPRDYDVQRLGTAIVLYGEMAERGGDLDEAWRRYRAALAFVRLVRRRCFSLGEAIGDWAERTVEAQLIRWGASQGQTVEGLRTALDELQKLDKQDQPLADVVLRSYQQSLNLVNDVQVGSSVWDDKLFGSTLLPLARRWTPWEFSRCRRLLRYMASLGVADARDADAALDGRVPPLSGSRLVRQHRDAQRLAETTLLFSAGIADFGEGLDGLINGRREALACRRATQLALAAEMWRLEHGELPERLTDLQGAYFDKLPLDPSGNQPFVWFRWGLTLDASSRNASQIPAGTPLIFSPGYASEFSSDARSKWDQLRRRSPDEPLWEDRMLAFEAAVAAGGGPTPAGAAGVVERLDGLAFPIPHAPDGDD